MIIINMARDKLDLFIFYEKGTNSNLGRKFHAWTLNFQSGHEIFYRGQKPTTRAYNFQPEHESLSSGMKLSTEA
jgi:hypothetical protein